MANDGGPDGRESNPFVVFRRLVDDEIRSAFSTFGFPSHPIHGGSSFDHSALKRYSDNYERATSPERTSIQPRSGDDAAPDSDEPPRPDAPSRAPVGDDLWRRDDGGDVYRPTASFFWKSPYSPSRLRWNALTEDHTSAWERAFEHLLAITQGRDDHMMGDASAYGKTSSYVRRLQRQGLVGTPAGLEGGRGDATTAGRSDAATTGMSARAPAGVSRHGGGGGEGERFEEVVAMAEAMRHHLRQWLPLTFEMMMPPVVPALVFGGDHYDEHGGRGDGGDEHDWDDSGEDSEDTELARYMQLLGPRGLPHYGEREVRESAPASTHAMREGGIVSEVKRVQRRREADGSWVTKTSVEKTYADGRKESEESTESSPPTDHERQKTAQEDRRLTPLKAALHEEKRKKGSWFWSS